MRIYDIAFYVVVFFLLGILAASLKIDFIIIVLAAVLVAAIFLFSTYFQSYEVQPRKIERKLFWFAGLSLFIIVGALYYFVDDYRSRNINITFDQKISFEGIVTRNPARGNQQKLTIELQPPYSGRVLVKLKNYPSFNYGDLISFEGQIKKPEKGSYANYLAKDKIFGTISYPKTNFISSGHGSKIKSTLFSLKERTVSNFQKVLPAENAAFLSGITLGERAEFSKEFKEAMSKSGTTHLVALSGYNITILVVAIAYILSSFVSRRLVFWLTLLIIIGFVIMTGAEASVVRAAVMGGIILLAKRANRLYSFRNAIAIAGFLMVLENPKVLSFDIGFQLSFMALLGIVYLRPAIQKFFKFSEKPGFLLWKENFLTTFSAQLFVLPLLVLYFGNFSPISLLSNILILSVIPLTMTLGFIIGFLGFIHYYFSLIFGWLTNLLLSYETFVIKFLGELNILQINSLSVPLVITYYFILIVFILYARRLPKPRQNF
ncbi:MAG TPA: ComEC family competence protein [Candidatus Wolfebacteria bacterium]|nr:ComEC family competence protein [Candidatus Wolfebacteria bacterium]